MNERDHLEAPASSFVLASKTTGDAISAEAVRETPDPARRDVLKGALATAIWTGVKDWAGILATVIAAEEAVRARLKEREDDHETSLRDARRDLCFVPASGIAGRIREVFPFMADPDEIALFPNTDNKLLKPMGIGDGDATVADHIRLHDAEVDATVDLDHANDKGVASQKDDIHLFSFGTLAQSRFLHAALNGQELRGGDLLSRVRALRQPFDPKRVNVIVGSPTGNRLSGLFRGKVRRHEADRERELVHEGVRGLTFPFEFSLDRDVDSAIYDPIKGSYKWSLQDTSSDDAIRSGVDGIFDYFTISTVPNFLAEDFAAAPPVVMVEGCSAVGTSGVSVLWANAGSRALQALISQIQAGSGRYWQALFGVTGISDVRTNALGNQERVAVEVMLVKFGWISPVTRDLRYHSVLVRDSLRRSLNQLRTARRLERT
jgi:hypothetical protein